MMYDELNDYIKNYVKQDNVTGRAIMLSGDWGTGKSFYIRYILKPHLKQDRLSCKVIVISLYGINSIQQLNTAVYTEFKWSNYLHKLPKFLLSIGFLTITSLFYQIYKDFHISLWYISPSWIINILLLNWCNFKSIKFEETIRIDDIKALRKKLGEKLIVLEDVERTKLDIVDLFSWVTTLCENGDAKILLVANEQKLKEKLALDDKQNKFYEKEKEKTIFETFNFRAEDAYNGIISVFNDEDLNKFKVSKNPGNEKIDNEFAEYRKTLISNLKCNKNDFNYRTFKLACQKIVNIFEIIRKIIQSKEIEVDNKFMRNVFINVVEFEKPSNKKGSFYSADLHGIPYCFTNPQYKYRTDVPCTNYDKLIKLKWDDEQYDGKLRHGFKFCYEYCVSCVKPTEKVIKETIEQYKKYLDDKERICHFDRKYTDIWGKSFYTNYTDINKLKYFNEKVASIIWKVNSGTMVPDKATSDEHIEDEINKVYNALVQDIEPKVINIYQYRKIVFWLYTLKKNDIHSDKFDEMLYKIKGDLTSDEFIKACQEKKISEEHFFINDFALGIIVNEGNDGKTMGNMKREYFEYLSGIANDISRKYCIPPQDIKEMENSRNFIDLIRELILKNCFQNVTSQHICQIGEYLQDRQLQLSDATSVIKDMAGAFLEKCKSLDDDNQKLLELMTQFVKIMKSFVKSRSNSALQRKELEWVNKVINIFENELSGKPHTEELKSIKNNLINML